jgi:hypothetical protein
VRAIGKPPFFKMGGNIDIFLSRFENYFKMCPLMTDEAKVVMLLNQFDESSFQILQHVRIPDADR